MRYTSSCALLLGTLSLVACGGSDLFEGQNDHPDGSSGAGAGTGAGGNSAAGQVVINEIHYDPNLSADDMGEWVELHNPGAKAVDLSGWLLTDKAGHVHAIDGLQIEAGGFVVLGRSDVDNGGAPIDQVYGDSLKLANDLDSVILEASDGQIVDQVDFETVAPWPPATPGVSLELSAPEMDNALGTSWQLAILTFGDGDRGTPGAPNGGVVSGYTVDEGEVSWHQPDLKTTVLFAPLDDLEGQVLSVLGTAETSIELAFFNIRLEGVRDLLIAKKNAGVSVHVLLDQKQQELEYNTMAEELIDAGVTVTMVENTRAVEATMHNKFAVIDGHVVMTGSANYSYTALNLSDEDLVTFDDTGLASRYAAEFDEILAGGNAASQPYSGDPGLAVWMGPEDSLTGKALTMLNAATSTAVLAMFELNTSSLVDALIDAHDRGVHVVVILDEVQAQKPGADAEVDLAAAGIEVVLADNTGNSVSEMHSKFLVVDHQHVMMGSYNWTNMASFYNDENVVIIEDAHLAARVEGKFADLVTAYGGSPAALGLTTGMQPVTFEVGNVTLDQGVTLVVVGNGPLAQGVELVNGSATLDVNAGTRLTYHYEIRHNGTTLATEPGHHGFTVPYAPGPFAVSDAFTP